ncbi:S24 family peptidase [Vibrio sp. 10N.237.312.C02]|uniref:LexA family transcriptional regulator n=2 Tax=Vibrionaceae TaxID=641 RepID=UPI00063106C5|nr:S24 family peptidase [Vibrio coralliirubri]CDT71839.1 hypothetical protein VCR29J2_430150 [Vibrio coralliirubri]
MRNNEKLLSLDDSTLESVHNRIERLMNGRVGRECAQDWDVPHSTLVTLLHRRSDPKLSMLLKIANAEDVTIDWLATGKDSSAQFVEVPVRKDNVVEVVQYNFQASAGAGCLVVSENPVARFEFSKEWLIRQGLNGKELTIVPVRGDSMEPTLMDEDLMLVEVVKDPKQARDGVCVFRIDDEVLVKRVQYDFASGGYHVTSDNTAYKPFFIGEEFEGRFQLLGRMVRVLQRAKKA